MAQNVFMALPKEHDGKEPWQRCPSTHCERARECRSPNECSGTGIAALIRDAKTNADRQREHRARRTAKLKRMTAALNETHKRLGADKSEWANGIRTLIQEALS